MASELGGICSKYFCYSLFTLAANSTSTFDVQNKVYPIEKKVTKSSVAASEAPGKPRLPGENITATNAKTAATRIDPTPCLRMCSVSNLSSPWFFAASSKRSSEIGDLIFSGVDFIMIGKNLLFCPFPNQLTERPRTRKAPGGDLVSSDRVETTLRGQVFYSLTVRCRSSDATGLTRRADPSMRRDFKINLKIYFQ